MLDCVFCKIATGDIPSRKSYHENDEIISFLDIDQKIPGHTLVIPAAHHQWFDEMPEDVSEKLFRASQRIERELKQKTSADFIKLAIVGTDVPHVHVHLLPLFFNDTPPSI